MLRSLVKTQGVQRAVESPGTAFGFADRKDAIELPAFEVPGGKQEAPAASFAAAKGPSPMNRPDAIEIEGEDQGPKDRAVPAPAPGRDRDPPGHAVLLG